MSEQDLDKAQVFREELGAANTTGLLMSVARKILRANTPIMQKGEHAVYKEDKSYFSRSSRSGDSEVLIIGRTIEPWREESMTLVLNEQTIDNLDGLSYFTAGERKDIHLKEKDGKMIEESWTVEPKDPLLKQAALPKAREILEGLLS